MSAGRPAAPALRRRRLAAAAGALLLVLAAGHLLRGPILRALLVRAVERGTGVGVAVGEVGGSLVGGVTIRDVRTVRPGTGGPLVELGIEKLRASWALHRLLGGLDAFVAGARIEVDGARVALDLGPRPGAAPGEATVQPAAPFAPPRAVPGLAVRGLAVTATRPGLDVRVAGLSLSGAGSASGRWEISIGAERLAVEAPGVTVGPAPLAAVIRADGAALGAEASVPGRGVQVTLGWREGALEAALGLDGVDLGAGEGLVTLPEGSLEGRLSGEAGLALRPGAEPAASASVVLEAARVRGIPLERLSLEAALAAGVLRVGSLEARSGPNRVRVHDAAVPLAALRAADAAAALRDASGALEADLGDLPALLALAGRPLPVPAGAVPRHALELSGSLDAGVLAIGRGRLALARGGVDVERLRVTLPPPGEPWAGTELAGALEIDLPEISVLNRILPLPPLAGALAGRVELGGTVATLRGSARVAARRLAVRGRTVGDLELDAAAGEGRLLVRSFSLSQGAGANRASVGNLALPLEPLAARRWQAALAAATGAFSARLGDLPALLAVAGRAPPAAAVPPHRVDLAGRLGSGTVELSRGELGAAGNRVVLERARAELAAEGRPWGETRIDAAAAAELPDPGALATLLGLPQVAGRLRARATVRGSVASPQWEASAEGAGVAVRGVGGIALELGAAGERDLVRVERLELRRGEDVVEASGAYAVRGRRIDRGRARFVVAQAAAYAALLPEGVPALSGRLEGEVTAAGGLDEPSGALRVTAAEVFVGGSGPLGLAVSAAFSGGAVAFDRCELQAPQGELSALGTLERLGDRGARLRLTALALRRGGAAARLAGPAVLRFDPPDSLAVDGLRLEGAAGSLAISGRVGGEGSPGLEFSAAGLGTEGWLRGLGGGRVTVRGAAVRGSVRGSRARPALRLEGEVAEVASAGIPAPISGRFDLSWEAGLLTVAAFEWSGGEGFGASASGTLPFDPLGPRLLPPGELGLAARLEVGDLRALSPLLPATVGVDGALAASAALAGTWEEPTGEVAVTAKGVKASGIAALEGQGPFAAELEVLLRPGAAELRRLRVSGAGLSAEAAGSWTGLPAPGALLGGGERPELDGTLALRGRFTVPELSAVRALLGAPRRLAGSLDGEFSVAGRPRDPQVEATVRLAGGALDYGRGVPPLERLALEAKVSGRTVRLVGATGESGGAPFRLGGELAWGEEARVDLALAGENLLLYRDARLTVRADLDLRARGPLAGLGLEGEALLRNSSYSRTVTLPELLGAGGRRKPPSAPGPLFSLRGAPWRDLRFGVRIGTGSPFELRTNLARGAVRPDLTLTGTGALPVLSGNVFVDPTRVSLPAGALAFERGIVSFPKPGAGQPRLDLAGRTRLLGYDVAVQVGGTVRSPEVTLSSIPPLPDDELLLLVLAGTPPGTADAQAMKRILEANLARFVAEGILGTVTGSGPGGGELGERIEVEVGRNVTRSGTATVETRFRVVGGEAPTGGALYLTGGTDVYDAYTMGVTVVFRFR